MNRLRYNLVFWIIAGLLIVSSISSQTTVQAQDEDGKIKLVVLYSWDHEKFLLESNFGSMNTSDMHISYHMIEEFNFDDLENFDYLLYTNQRIFSLSNESVDSLNTFVSQEGKTTVFFTPNLGYFPDTLKNNIGVANATRYSIRGNSSDFWRAEFNENFGSYSQEDEFAYGGRLGLFRQNENSTVIASITGSNSSDPVIQNLNFPLPAIINASKDGNQIITSSLSILSRYPPQNQSRLSLSQLPSFNEILAQIITHTISHHQTNFKPRVSTDQAGDTDGSIFDIDLPEIDILLIGLVALLALFIRKIADSFRWLLEKTYGVAFFVFGVFYNVQERNLTDAQVLTNISRVNIVHFLENMAEYGAHLREIKATLNIGMGALLWHLQVLEDYGWIEKYKIDRYTIFVAAEDANSFDFKLKELELKLKSKHSLEFIRFILEMNSAQSIPDIARETKIDKKTLRRFSKTFAEYKSIELIKKRSTYIKVIDKTMLEKIGYSLQLRSEYQQDQNAISVHLE